MPCGGELPAMRTLDAGDGEERPEAGTESWPRVVETSRWLRSPRRGGRVGAADTPPKGEARVAGVPVGVGLLAPFLARNVSGHAGIGERGARAR